MATTYSKVADIVAGNSRKRIIDISFTSTQYASGGIALAAADYSSLINAPASQSTTQSMSYILSFNSEKNSTGQTLALDRTNQKIQVFLGSTEATTTISSTTTTTSRAVVIYGVHNKNV